MNGFNAVRFSILCLIAFFGYDYISEEKIYIFLWGKFTFMQTERYSCSGIVYWKCIITYLIRFWILGTNRVLELRTNLFANKMIRYVHCEPLYIRYFV